MVYSQRSPMLDTGSSGFKSPSLVLASGSSHGETNFPQDLLKHYEPLKRIAVGGMGTVYKVKALHDGQIYAVKLLNDKLLNSEEALARFLKEEASSIKLDHPNIVRTYDKSFLFEGEETLYPHILMEFVEGESLADLIEREGALDFELSAKIFKQILSAIEYAHRAQVVHRDLKPANLLVVRNSDQNYQVKVVDFGIAAVLLDPEKETCTFTATGEFFGSPHYMSPEMCQGEKADALSDIYSLGIILYEMLSGKPPFDGKIGVKIILSQLKENPPLIKEIKSRPELTGFINSVVLKALSKNPAERFQTAAQFKEDLESIEAGKLPEHTVCETERLRQARVRAQLLDGLFKVLVVVPLIFVALPATDLNHFAEHYPQISIILALSLICLLESLTAALVPILIFFVFFNCLLHATLNFPYTVIWGLSFIAVYSWLYDAVLESSAMQCTIGKAFLGLKTLDKEGKTMDFLEATARHFQRARDSFRVFFSHPPLQGNSAFDWAAMTERLTDNRVVFDKGKAPLPFTLSLLAMFIMPYLFLFIEFLIDRQRVVHLLKVPGSILILQLLIGWQMLACMDTISSLRSKDRNGISSVIFKFLFYGLIPILIFFNLIIPLTGK